MPDDKAVSATYAHGNLYAAIEAAIIESGKTIDNITIEDLAPVDEFHIGGRAASERFLSQLKLDKNQSVLDIGCGLGGAARFVAHKYGCQVSGIDLTHEYVETGNALCKWVNLDRQISLQQGSALLMPFKDAQFDAAYMMHVGMNIEEKLSLFSELFRVLRTGAYLGIYDVMQQDPGNIAFPVPWAREMSTSYLATPERYKQALNDAGFTIIQETNRRNYAIEFFEKLSAATQARGGPPPLGLHTLMQGSTAAKIANMVQNIGNNYIAPVEIIVQKD
jgi:ubiquinone/menaquinone biosynthesis C-methylase UbiE